jgi:methylmalonyl-CoA epimerase
LFISKLSYLPKEAAMEFRRIHHVAIAHESGAPILATLAESCGLEVGDIEDGPGFTERMWAVGDSHVQTLEATGDGVIRRSVDARGPGLHHIAFEVDDLVAALSDLRRDGIRLIDETPRPGGGGTEVAFIHPSSFGGVLVELVQVLDPETDGGA